MCNSTLRKYVSAAVDDVPRAEVFRNGGPARDLVRGKRWLLLTGWAHLDGAGRRSLNELFPLNRRLAKACFLRETRERLWSYTYAGAARPFLTHCIRPTAGNASRDFSQVAQLLLHLNRSLTYCQAKVPFGKSEAIHGNLAAMLWRGRGSRDHGYLIHKLVRAMAENGAAQGRVTRAPGQERFSH